MVTIDFYNFAKAEPYALKIMRYFLILNFCFVSFFALGQIKDYTTEKTTLSHTNAQVGDEVEVVFEVQIAKDWYIYSSEFKAEGPNRAEFIFTPHTSYQLIGSVQAINPKRKHDEVWEGEIAYFEKKAEFRQKIKILSPMLKIAGEYNFQSCSNVTGQCLPPETVKFAFDQTHVKITKGKK